MLFNSLDFAIFLPIVFFLYWFVFKKHLKAQNALIVVASYVFYGWWDWRFLSLIAFSTLVDFLVGLRLKNEERQSRRKALLWISILVNLGFLGFFKYYNFFLESFVDAFSLMGYQFKGYSMNIILPVGISFYTFQTLSYTIDVYKRRLEPTKDLISFSAFVSFFPQLVAGPIERATNLLPQFYKKREFDYAKAVDGMRQILWGLFKKVVIADNCAETANLIFNNYQDYNGSTLLIGAIFFAFQIYGDFSGYSDIAIGTARLFGFNLMQNFATPYFSRDIAEFWRRWHISLSTWFRDYVYIPLGGSRGGKWMKVRNTFIIFIVSGFWHGANWTFIVWGALNAIYFLPLLLANKNRTHLGVVAENRMLPSLKELGGMGLTFFLTVIAWVFFRAEDINHAFSYINRITHDFLTFNRDAVLNAKVIMAIITFFLLLEWWGRSDQFAIQTNVSKMPKFLRYALYYLIIISVFWFGGKEEQFIYFQF
jgi:D-alanyl-lipoteichoic acid acyltransferase DltB (MBOAT superfamily)